MEEIENEIRQIMESISHLTLEQQQQALMTASSRIGTEEWKNNVLDLMNRMNLI